jgi:hypothetical protein
MLIDGLDALPQRGQMGEMMVDLLASTMGNDDSRRKVEKEMEQRKLKGKMEKELLIEDSKILQGKLLMLKRYLSENKLMTEVNNVLNSEKK